MRQLSSGYTQSALPLYYTSVVDLKPFDQAELARISRQHQRNQSPIGNQLPVIKRNSRSNNQNRKFLINKSIRLYQPIHEAAMMSKIGQLRHKLASAKPEIQKVSRLSLASRTVNDPEQTNYEKFIEPYKETIETYKNNDNKPKCFDDTLEEEQIKNKNFETLNNPIQTSTDQMDTIGAENRNQAPYNTSRGVNNQVPNFEETFHDFNSIKPPPSAVSGMSRQDRILTARKTPRHFVPIFHEPNFQLSQTKVQHLIRQSTRNRFSNIYKTDDNEDEPEHMNNNNPKSILSKAAVNSLENMNHFTYNAPNNNNNNNNKVSRSEAGDTSTTVTINKSMHKYNIRTATNLSLKSLPNKYSESAPPKSASSDRKNKPIRPETAVHNKKLHPALKHKKEKEAQCIENIINDVPSSIKIMSKKGKATNIEKLIAVKLSEYYSNNRLIY